MPVCRFCGEPIERCSYDDHGLPVATSLCRGWRHVTGLDGVRPVTCRESGGADAESYTAAVPAD